MPRVGPATERSADAFTVALPGCALLQDRRAFDGWTFVPDGIYEEWNGGRDGYGLDIVIDRAAGDQSVYLEELKRG
ncbi:hypothetical protein ABT369_54285 [Dactylosporangium sp. NPDC000244]|uniref:hypothetical protein n=1 Tax=Dactylosporangium sp. NPDC000244 TaxID=3154365 RepID=UPI003328DDC6